MRNSFVALTGHWAEADGTQWSPRMQAEAFGHRWLRVVARPQQAFSLCHLYPGVTSQVKGFCHLLGAGLGLFFFFFLLVFPLFSFTFLLRTHPHALSVQRWAVCALAPSAPPRSSSPESCPTPSSAPPPPQTNRKEGRRQTTSRYCWVLHCFLVFHPTKPPILSTTDWQLKV